MQFFLILSTGERSFGHFMSSRCYDPMIFNFADPESRSEMDLRWKIAIAWKWRLKNKCAGNRSCGNRSLTTYMIEGASCTFVYCQDLSWLGLCIDGNRIMTAQLGCPLLGLSTGQLPMDLLTVDRCELHFKSWHPCISASSKGLVSMF